MTELIEAAQKNHAILVKGAEASLVCGKVLREIRDKHQYTALGFNSFTEYLTAECPFSERHALRLMATSETWDRIEPFQDKYPVVGKLNSISKLELLSPVDQSKIKSVVARLNKVEELSPREIKAAVKENGQTKAKPPTDTEPSDTPYDVEEPVAPATAAMPESYVDERGNDVPESLWPVWRQISEIAIAAAKLRELAGVVGDLSKKLDDSELEAISSTLEVNVKRLRNQTPAVVDGDGYLTKGELEG